MIEIRITYNINIPEEVQAAHDAVMKLAGFDKEKLQQNSSLLDNENYTETWEVELQKEVEFHKDWTAGNWLVRGKTVRYNDNVYRIIQSHTATVGSEPNVALSLFRPVPIIYPGETYPRWDSIGVLDSENNWDAGERVTWNGQEWESDIDNNIYEPGASSWTNLSSGGGVDCSGVSPWVSTQAWNTYTVGDRRTNNGHLWELHTQAWAQAEPSGPTGYLGWTDLGQCTQ